MTHFTQDDFEKIKLRSYLLLQCMRRRREGTSFELEERRWEIEIMNNMTLSEFNESRACGLQNFVRPNFLIYKFKFCTRAEQEAKIKYSMRGRKRDNCLKLLRSTYK